MSKTSAAAADKVPHLRVTTDVARRVTSAGMDWAGISELPLAHFTAAQLVELKTDKRLQVEEIERPLAPDPTPAQA